MDIELKGDLHPELKAIGLKPGEIIRNASGPHPNHAVHFDKYHNGHEYHCSVWPENYQPIIKQEAV